MPKHGKRYVEVAKLVDRETVYLLPLSEVGA